ncbi:MAG: efflux RND transporter periplasmic adaptor subunit [Pseudomonadota bacterium]
MPRTARNVVLAGAVLLVAACNRAEPPKTTAAASGLATFEVQLRKVPQERRLDGVIEAVNQGTVAAQTSGRVTAINYDVNDFVPAGAVIVQLRATEQRSGLLQAEAALREALSRETEAQTRYQRVSDMYARKVVAKAMLDEVSTARDAAVARLAAARAGRDSAREGVAYTEVRAPYAGIVTRRLVQVGETVAPGTPLVSGLSLQYLRVVVDVPQSAIEQVRSIRKAAIYVGERRIEATKLTVFPEAATPSITFRARLDLPENATDLYPGMFVKAAFVVGEALRLRIPASAMVERSEVAAVYVVSPEGRVTMRQIRPGLRMDGEVEVLAGLDAGERVAVDPAAALKSATR